MESKEIIAWLMNLFTNTYIQTNDKDFSVNHVRERYEESIYYCDVVFEEFESKALNWSLDKS